jgi:hypothetical protein
MAKWIVIIALIILAPMFVINLVTGTVNFISTQGKALVTEVAKEASKTVKEAGQ